jgi:hypothetical protein
LLQVAPRAHFLGKTHFKEKKKHKTLTLPLITKNPDRENQRKKEQTISFKRVFPSFVSFISPAPPTSLKNTKTQSN